MKFECFGRNQAALVALAGLCVQLCLLEHVQALEPVGTPTSQLNSSPLALAWRNQQQQQQQLQKQQQQLAANSNNNASSSSSSLSSSTILPTRQTNQTPASWSGSSLSLINQQQVSLSPATTSGLSNGKPVTSADFNESLVTDFPNPNINNAGHEITKILKKFFQHGYDKRVRPNYSGPPALVNVSFHIIGISSVSEVQMDFTTDFYFRQKWFDPRLEFKPVGQIDELCVGAEFAEKIWLPDTFFANEKTATFHKATTENTFIRVGHNGRVYRSIRLTVTCSCPMDLQYFPMDRQRCKIEIESYGYNTRDIDYRWEKGNESVSLDGKIELPQFKVLGFKMGHELQSLSSGDYIRLYCEIHFVRSMGYYLIQIYIPASLIVIISWVSFWLHRNATPARVALGVTTVLTMTTLMSSTNAALPKISYIKSIDVFLGTCFVMVFASLLEYASVGYIGKRIAMKRKRQQDLKQMQQHHQRTCLAAAAAAKATAAAAQQTNPVGVAAVFVPNSKQSSGSKLGSFASGVQAKWAALGNAGNEAQHQDNLNQGSILVRRFAGSQAQPSLELEPPSYASGTAGRRSTIKIMLEQPWAAGHASLANKQAPQPAGELSGQPKAEFELAAGTGSTGAAQGAPGTGKKEQDETVRICGLTPSAIDKYSRVVFPICFVCFNLMYWIIYGHISQQIDDKGPPLIPFVRS